MPSSTRTLWLTALFGVWAIIATILLVIRDDVAAPATSRSDPPSTSTTGRREQGAQTPSGSQDAGLPEAADAAAPEPPPVTASRYVVCQAHATLPRLSIVDTPGLGHQVAVHCGQSVHLIATVSMEGAPQPLRTARFDRHPAVQGVAAAPVGDGDIDGDGEVDLVLPMPIGDPTRDGPRGALHWVRGSSARAFETPQRLASLGPSAVEIVESDGARDAALVALMPHSELVRKPSEVWLYSGGPAPMRAARWEASSDARALAVLRPRAGDALQAWVASPSHVERWTLEGEAPEPLPPLAIGGVREMIAGDLDADGTDDMLLVAEALWRARAGDTGEPESLGGPASLRDVRLLREPGSGRPMLVGYAHPELLRLHPKEGSLESTTLARIHGSGGVLATAIADFDANQQLDVAILLSSGAGSRHVEMALLPLPRDTTAIQLADSAAALSDAPLSLHVTLP